MDAILGLILLVGMLTIYFIPTIIAYKRMHFNRVAVLVLNLFLGWTFVGWVGALVWAVTSKPITTVLD